MNGLFIILGLVVLFPLIFLFGTVFFGKSKREEPPKEDENSRFGKYE